MREADDDLECGVCALAGLDHVIPAPAGLIGEHLRLPGEELREEAHVVRVVGDHEEVERSGELHPLAARRRDLVAFGEAVGVLRRQPGAERAGVHREGRVHVRVPEEGADREVAPRRRRIRWFPETLLSCFLVQRARVLCPCGQRQAHSQQSAQAETMKRCSDHRLPPVVRVMSAVAPCNVRKRAR